MRTHREDTSEREAARLHFYVERYGSDALRSPDGRCVTFAEPDCGDWNCLNPAHQQLQAG